LDGGSAHYKASTYTHGHIHASSGIQTQRSSSQPTIRTLDSAANGIFCDNLFL